MNSSLYNKRCVKSTDNLTLTQPNQFTILLFMVCITDDRDNIVQYSNAPKQVNAFVTDAPNILHLIQPVKTEYICLLYKKNIMIFLKQKLYKFCLIIRLCMSFS